jgi:hypothetical protein
MILALRLFMTPILIAGATLAGRRWGPRVSGWLIGFPLTSGPVSFILALQYGSDFATHAAIGNLAGLTSIVAFALAYHFTSRKQGWLVSASIAALAFIGSTFIFNSFTLTLLPTFVIVVISIGLFLKIVPHQDIAANTAIAPKWDLPVRMIIATVFVVSLTAAASVLGPQLSGLITPFPVFGTVLSIFAHQRQGPNAAVQLLRGMGLSLFGVAGFFLIVGGLLPTLGLVPTYLLAVLIDFATNGLALYLSRQNKSELFEEV